MGTLGVSLCWGRRRGGGKRGGGGISAYRCECFAEYVSRVRSGGGGGRVRVREGTVSI